jgi:hypothetical protein
MGLWHKQIKQRQSNVIPPNGKYDQSVLFRQPDHTERTVSLHGTAVSPLPRIIATI